MIAGTSDPSYMHESKHSNRSTFTIPNDVKPTRMALYKSCPCENKSAKIRNAALSEMRKGDVGNVSYYILKCKRGIWALGVPFVVVFAAVYYLFVMLYQK